MTKPTRHTPTQKRSRETVNALLDAVTRLFVKSPLHSIDVNEIARVAGVGIGSVYRYFDTKEALLVAWEEREVERVGQAVAGFFADAAANERSAAENTRRLVESIYDALLPLALRHAESGTEGVVRFAKRTEDISLACAVIGERLRARGVRVRHPEVAGYVGVVAFLQTMFACARMKPEAARDGRLRDELVDMLVRYLAPDA